MTENSWDAVVVGAGLAGLAAATTLRDAGLDVLVLEARGRTGGRVHSLPVRGGIVEAGATWFWGNEPLIRGFCERLGLATYGQYLGGDALWEGLAPAVQRLPGNPLDAPAARLRTGADQLTTGLANTLPTGSLRLNSPVTAVTVTDRAVQVDTQAGSTRADQVILALPPAVAVAQIAFTPALPGGLQTLALQTPVWMGNMVKAVATYDEPFWRAEGLAGAAMSHRGPFRELHDHSGPEGTPAALFGFAPGMPHTGAGSGPQHAAFTEQLVRLFGPRAADSREVHVVDWGAERYTQPAGPTEGSGAAFGAAPYQQPVHGRVHWASTETATAFAGHMEGAIRAGLAAAQAVRRKV